jgi:hypothetical protein
VALVPFMPHPKHLVDLYQQRKIRIKVDTSLTSPLSLKLSLKGMTARLSTRMVVTFKWMKVKMTFLGVTLIYLGTCSSLHKVTRCPHVSFLFP